MPQPTPAMVRQAAAGGVWSHGQMHNDRASTARQPRPSSSACSVGMSTSAARSARDRRMSSGGGQWHGPLHGGHLGHTGYPADAAARASGAGSSVGSQKNHDSVVVQHAPGSQSSPSTGSGRGAGRGSCRGTGRMQQRGIQRRPVSAPQGTRSTGHDPGSVPSGYGSSTSNFGPWVGDVESSPANVRPGGETRDFVGNPDTAAPRPDDNLNAAVATWIAEDARQRATMRPAGVDQQSHEEVAVPQLEPSIGECRTPPGSAMPVLEVERCARVAGRCVANDSPCGRPARGVKLLPGSRASQSIVDQVVFGKDFGEVDSAAGQDVSAAGSSAWQTRSRGMRKFDEGTSARSSEVKEALFGGHWDKKVHNPVTPAPAREQVLFDPSRAGLSTWQEAKRGLKAVTVASEDGCKLAPCMTSNVMQVVFGKEGEGKGSKELVEDVEKSIRGMRRKQFHGMPHTTSAVYLKDGEDVGAGTCDTSVAGQSLVERRQEVSAIKTLFGMDSQLAGKPSAGFPAAWNNSHGMVDGTRRHRRGAPHGTRVATIGEVIRGRNSHAEAREGKRFHNTERFDGAAGSKSSTSAASSQNSRGMVHARASLTSDIFGRLGQDQDLSSYAGRFSDSAGIATWERKNQTSSVPTPSRTVSAASSRTSIMANMARSQSQPHLSPSNISQVFFGPD